MNLKFIRFPPNYSPDGKHLMPIATKRLATEMMRWKKQEEEYRELGFSIVDNSSIHFWHIMMNGPKESLYDGEIFELGLFFDDRYPFTCPYVVFLNAVPEHEHIYSNGHICLSILYNDYSPSLSIIGVLLSLQSMLASARAKKRPPNDRDYSSSHANMLPRRDIWIFDDDKA